MKSYKDKLGNATWSFLHTIAQGYPDEPSTKEQAQWHKFYKNLAKIYPCDKCKHHFQSYLKHNPPMFDNHKQAELYFFKFHNVVNTRLNKTNISLNEYFKLYK